MKNIKKQLKQGGTLYSFTLNPLVIPEAERYYGISGSRPQKEGDGYTDILHNEKGEELFSVRMFYWSLATIKLLLEKNGFIEFEKLPVLISEEGIKNYSNGYWKDFLNNPLYLMFQGSK